MANMQDKYLFIMVNNAFCLSFSYVFCSSKMEVGVLREKTLLKALGFNKNSRPPRGGVD